MLATNHLCAPRRDVARSDSLILILLGASSERGAKDTRGHQKNTWETFPFWQEVAANIQIMHIQTDAFFSRVLQ